MIQRTPQRQSNRQPSLAQAKTDRSVETTVTELVELLRRPEGEQNVGQASDVLGGIQEVFQNDLTDKAIPSEQQLSTDCVEPNRSRVVLRDRLTLIESELNIADNSSPLRSGLRCSLLKTLARMLKLKRGEKRNLLIGAQFAGISNQCQPLINETGDETSETGS